MFHVSCLINLIVQKCINEVLIQIEFKLCPNEGDLHTQLNFLTTKVYETLRIAWLLNK